MDAGRRDFTAETQRRGGRQRARKGFESAETAESTEKEKTVRASARKSYFPLVLFFLRVSASLR
jgi:hypothetical protein